MNDAFARLTDPIFQYVIDFQHSLSNGETPALKDVKARILDLFAEAERKAAATRELASDFAMARHALVYWTDEMLITSRWKHAEEWRNHIIEWDLYNENLAGEKFFTKAEEAERLTSTDPLETFLLCVCLGFQGKYAFDPTALKNFAERAFSRVGASSSQSDRFLADDPADSAREALRPLPGQSILLNLSLLTSVTALVTLIAFLWAINWRS